MEDIKILLQEVKEGVVEAVTPAITAEVIKSVEEKMAQIKPVQIDKDSKEAEAKEATVKAFKDMYAEMKNGAKTVSKALDTETATAGEELVPEYFNSEVVRVTEKHGVARRDARVIQMRGKIEKWPTLGSVSVSRVDEKGKIPVVTPTTGTVSLTAKKLAAIIPMSREVLEYSNINVINQISQLAGEAMARAEDTWAFKGLEAGEGIFRNTVVPTHIMGVGKTSYADVTFSDLLALQDLIDDGAFVDGDIKYYLRRSVLNSLRGSILAAGESNLAQALVAMSLKDLAGLPFETVSILPSTLDDNDAGEQAGEKFMGLYNLKHLLMGVGRSYEIEMSREATINTTGTAINLWEQDMVAVRIIESIDFAVTNADKAFATLVTATDLS